MKHGELTLRQKSGNVVGTVNVSLRFDIPEEMMQMLVTGISKAVEHWADRIIVNSHNK